MYKGLDANDNFILKIQELEEILIIGSKISSNSLRKRLLSESVLNFECSCCKLTEWNNKPISLELDHINGTSNDNRLENLRLLCPNCHSQTETYRGKNIKGKYLSGECAICKTKISSQRTYCIICFKQKQYNTQPLKIEIIKNCIDCNEEFKEDSNRCRKCRGILCNKTKIIWPSKEELEKYKDKVCVI